MSGAVDGLHRSVSEKRHSVDRIDFPRRSRVSLIEVAVATDDSSRLGSVTEHFFVKAGCGFGGSGWLVPFHLEKLAGLHSGPGGIGDDGDARAGVVVATRTGGLAELVR